MLTITVEKRGRGGRTAPKDGSKGKKRGPREKNAYHSGKIQNALHAGGRRNSDKREPARGITPAEKPTTEPKPNLGGTKIET